MPLAAGARRRCAGVRDARLPDAIRHSARDPQHAGRRRAAGARRRMGPGDATCRPRPGHRNAASDAVVGTSGAQSAADQVAAHRPGGCDPPGRIKGFGTRKLTLCSIESTSSIVRVTASNSNRPTCRHVAAVVRVGWSASTPAGPDRYCRRLFRTQRLRRAGIVPGSVAARPNREDAAIADCRADPAPVCEAFDAPSAVAAAAVQMPRRSDQPVDEPTATGRFRRTPVKRSGRRRAQTGSRPPRSRRRGTPRATTTIPTASASSTWGAKSPTSWATAAGRAPMARAPRARTGRSLVENDRRAQAAAGPGRRRHRRRDRPADADDGRESRQRRQGAAPSTFSRRCSTSSRSSSSSGTSRTSSSSKGRRNRRS